ncbi:MAG: hypothetical protein U5Q44_14745 [Dehalococcoidia bacterium]|nr:hypothetical protein [Dehalococcoidia bacterium]
MIHALLSGAAAFVLAVALGLPIVRYLRGQRIGKSIGEYLSDTHSHKQGVPTFGGFIIWVPTFLVAAVAVDWWNHRSILLPMLVIGATGAVGFLDDMGTLQNRVARGLSWRFKMLFLTALASGTSWILYEYIGVESINIPWVGQYSLGLWFLPIAIATIVATTTAVAISDGLDALAGRDDA